jgi:DNA-binding response OmpR family regulator
MTGRRILVVEDNADLRELLQVMLSRAGFEVVEAGDGRAALRALFSQRPDLVMLDVAMPALDGWQTLDRIREVSDVPVLMLTGSASELEKVRGLRGGADDYVTKPFGRQELVARVEVLLRRSRRPSEGESQIVDDGLVMVDFHQRAVEVDGSPVSLTPLEFRLLTAFVRHPNQVLSRQQLLDLVWMDNTIGSGDQVKLYVSYLRRKLAGATEAETIETVRGFGYRYRPPRRRAA